MEEITELLKGQDLAEKIMGEKTGVNGGAGERRETEQGKDCD